MQTILTGQPLEPPISAGSDQRGAWFPATPADPVAQYIQDHLWERPEQAQEWEVTPLSREDDGLGDRRQVFCG